jgi:diguanylate cyclase (GGDEF)-like protein
MNLPFAFIPAKHPFDPDPGAAGNRANLRVLRDVRLPNAAIARVPLPIAAMVVVLLHLCLGLLYPQTAWITCAAWMTMYALALATALLESRIAPPGSRWRWELASVNFTLATIGFLCILYGEYIVRFSPQAAWLNDLLRAFRALPFLLLVCTPEEAERPINRLLDFGQITLIALIFLVLFTPGLFTHPIGLAPLAANLFNSYSYTQSVVIACLSILAVFTAKTADSRQFHRALALYLSIGFPIALWTNDILINTWNVPPASALFVFSDLCLLVFIFAVPMLRYRIAAREPSRKLVFFRLGASAFLPLFALLASMILAIAGHHPILGITAGMISLLLFGIRSTYGQFQLLSVQWALQSANLQLETLSQHDPLTGLYNRRWFDETFVLEWERAQRSTLPLALLLIDVDHFKLFNDSRGHAQGDSCLQTVSSLLARQLRRSTDSLARYGGEEFVAMLPNTDADGARIVAERMVATLAESAIAHPASPFAIVTVSIGAAVRIPSDFGPTRENFFSAVDAALYQAKNQGRNSIRFAKHGAMFEPSFGGQPSLQPGLKA